MLLSPRVYGTHAAERMRIAIGAAVLTIGRDRFSRADLAHVECFSFLAAARLTLALATLGAKSTQHVYDAIGPEALAVPGVGVVSLMVLGAAFEARGVGTIETWAALHRAKDQQREYLTFHTIKAHERADHERAKRPQKRKASE